MLPRASCRFRYGCRCPLSSSRRSLRRSLRRPTSQRGREVDDLIQKRFVGYRRGVEIGAYLQMAVAQISRYEAGSSAKIAVAGAWGQRRISADACRGRCWTVDRRMMSVDVEHKATLVRYSCTADHCCYAASSSSERRRRRALDLDRNLYTSALSFLRWARDEQPCVGSWGSTQYEPWLSGITPPH